MTIGKLIEVDIRNLWEHEQYDFSNWLAKPENIEELNNIIGLTLTDIEKEAYVGAYRCDLVAIDEPTDTKVIIENQLEDSNHDHLGKIITYASGLDAEVIIWIVKNAREEHRSAIEWLNNNMVKDINFFLIELRAYRIGDSLPAPKFEIVEQPNDFIKSTKSTKSDSDMNRSQSERLNFWTIFNEVVVNKGHPFNARKPSTDHWYNISIGTSEASISISLVNQSGYIGVELYIRDNKEMYDELYLEKDNIESLLSFPLEWQRLNNRKASRIITKIEDLDFDNHSNYYELMDDVISKVIAMRKVFKEYLNI
ncbi:DUF4268 domain-containing protein [Alkalibacterium olivapovliticus]|uniref:Uncharacterized protein DUF4268 n=1 Tax=Alkalibacterium olivapovliticus TaxID=99907 RepID=A0A2T0W3Z0_9LACT|nr:DUF4268 domain-containing protein [Alkalibacterium olivapovliticus]PRY80133.1 uncharacterized protein DUF4268 [Alkalibacterium olivapovliticus]